MHGATTDAVPIEIDGSAVQRAAKQAALAAHVSQTALSGARLQRLAGHVERYAPLAGRDNASALPWRPPAWLGATLRLSVVDARGADSWRWSEAPLRVDDAGIAHLQVRIMRDGGPRFARLASRLPSPWIFDHWGWCELG